MAQKPLVREHHAAISASRNRSLKNEVQGVSLIKSPKQPQSVTLLKAAE